MIKFLIGLFLGVFIGLFGISMTMTAKQAEETVEKIRNN